MQKIRYEIDPYNRLVITRAGDKSGLSRFRRALDGQFGLDGNNNLSYRVKAPLGEGAGIPHQIDLKGEWSLTDKHELKLTLNKLGRQTLGDRITLQGEILDVKGDSLLFAVTTTSKEGKQTTYVLNLSGAWKADENNRLTFRVKREKGAYDILTFTGAWEIGKNNQVIYRYEKAALIRKKRLTHALAFKGYWDIKEKARITYALDADTDSALSFAATAGVFREDYIKYEAGIMLKARARPVKRSIILSGRWKLKKDTGLVFEVEYGDGRIGAIVFGAEARLTDKDTVSFSLKSAPDNKDLGAEVEISRVISDACGEAFLRALASRRELAVYAGAAWRW